MEAREHFIGSSYYGGYGVSGDQFPQKPADQFVVDDLLDLPNEDLPMNDGFYHDNGNVVGNSSDSSNFTVIDSCNSSVSGGDTYFASRSFNDSSNFSTELCVPNDDVAELEWLSNFVEDSLSFSNTQNLQHQYSLVSGTKPPTPDTTRPGPGPGPGPAAQSHFLPETPLPSKSRSRRSRAAPCDWTTRLLHLSSKPPKAVPDLEDSQNPDQAARRCLHCAAEKTPQWRTGPMGPKTLCNACGVRYKSGRLVPEYRPAASPTFVSAKHSNSHRKVVELRRQKEMQRVAQQHQQILCHRSIVGLSNGYDDVFINHSGGPSYSHLISGSSPL